MNYTDPNTGEITNNPFRSEKRDALWHELRTKGVPISKEEFFKSLKEKKIKRDNEKGMTNDDSNKPEAA